MNESYEQHEETPATPLTHNKADGQSPGEILREARVAHDYSVEDLCAQTKLSGKSVRALEDNDFGALSQPVFARGYYRQCAKVLDIDTDRLMAAYTAWAGEPEVQSKPDSAVGVVPEDVTPRDWPVYGVIAAVVVVVLLAVIGIFALDSDEPENANATASGEVAVSDSENASPDSASGDTGGAGQTATSGNSASSGQTAAGGTATSRPTGGRNVNDTLGIEPPGDDNDSEAASEPAIPPNRLEMTFTGRSWVDVRDSSGARLLTGIYESGETREFDAEPPYKITLGFAPAVQMSIGGESVDVASQTTRGKTARMTVEARNGN